MNIYFAGIGGVGIGPLAEIALDAGYSVQGSDRNESLLTSKLQKRGIAVEIGEDTSPFLEASHAEAPIDWFVYTAALPHDHSELRMARALGIRVSKRDELLAHIIKDKNLKLIAIAGTHGKTTTTGMLVWVLKELNIPVSYSVGTTLRFGPSGTYQQGSEYFIYECDEFDRNFLHFSPYLAIITSLGYDHPDTYPTEVSYYAAFQQFIDQSHHTIIWQRDSAKLDPSPGNSWLLQDTEEQPLKLTGKHNRRNGTLVIKALEYLKLASNSSAIEILSRFPGTDRRFERLADNLYTDYGHHPAEIIATLQLAKEISDHVVLVYQPHQNIRQHEIKNEYINCFKDANEIYWLPTYLSREDPGLPILTPEELTKDIQNPPVHLADLNDSLWNAIEKARQSGKLVLCMGAGNIDAWLRTRLTI